MYLTEIAAALLEAINTSLPGDWPGGVVLPTDLSVRDALDPFSTTDDTDSGVYIIPGYNEFDFSLNRDTSRGRSPRGISKIRRITVAVCVPLDSKLELSSSYDVAPKSEWSLLSNLREDLENFLMSVSIDGLKLVDMESEPPDEASLDEKLFLAATVLGYRAC